MLFLFTNSSVLIIRGANKLYISIEKIRPAEKSASLYFKDSLFYMFLLSSCFSKQIGMGSC